MPTMPGNYEFRLFGSGGLLATSGTVTVNQGPTATPTNTLTPTATTPPTTVTVNTSSVTTGGSVTLSWANIASPSASNWFGVFPAGSSNGSYVDWFWVSCTKTPGAAAASGSCA